MGFDLALITKNEVPSADGRSTRVHYLADRGLCTFILESKNNSRAILNQLQEILEVDLSFLLEPEHYAPRSIDEAEMRLRRYTEEMITKALAEEESGFVQIDPFLNQLSIVLEKMKITSDYEQRMQYDRKWWHSYFGKPFFEDLESVRVFLEKIKELGESEFSLGT